MLRRAVQKRPYDWEPLLPAVLQAYRSPPSESTGFTPSRFVFGREMRFSVDIGTNSLSLLATFASTQTFFPRISSGRIKSPAKWLEHSTKAQRLCILTTSSSNFSNSPSLSASFNIDVTTAPHQSLCRITLACVKYGQSEAQSSRFGSSTRREFTANHDAVRLASLTPNRLPAAAPPPPDADNHEPFPPLDAGHRAPSPTPFSTPPHSSTASPAIGDDALLAPPPVAAPQRQAKSDAQLDTNARPQRRRNPPPYLDDYVVSPFKRAYIVECAKILKFHS